MLGTCDKDMEEIISKHQEPINDLQELTLTFLKRDVVTTMSHLLEIIG